MRLADEKGVALVMVLILTGILSVLAASLIYVSQTETWSSQNYRLMSEARYGAESGVHKAANFLLYNYTPPTTAELSSYDLTKSPVVLTNGQPVVLRTYGGESNYPSESVANAFTSNAHGSLASGYTVSYDAAATLVSMRQVVVYGSTTPVTVQTWKIVGMGSIAGPKPGLVEVEAILEQQVSPVFKYAAFASYDGCGALKWAGGGRTDSYDSTAGTLTYAQTDANVGTNGNLTEVGSTTVIGGSLSTPRTGVGNCSEGNVTAWTLNGNGQLLGGVIELPQPVTYPAPTVPSPPPTGALSVGNGTTLTITSPPSVHTYGDINIKGSLHLTAGTYNINTIEMEAGGKLYIDTGPVILNVAGYHVAGDSGSGWDGLPVDFTGGSLITNTNFDPSMLQIQYAGTGEIRLTGGSSSVGLVYAPRAQVKLTGNGDWWGAIIGRMVDNSGSGAIHYDRRLSTKAWLVGPWMMNSFSWGRF